MTNFLRTGVLILAVLLCAAGCATKKSYVVLMDNADGTVGKLAVSGTGGEVFLDKPHTAAVLDGKAAEPFAVDESVIKRDFGPALQAQPLLPVSFLLYYKTGGTVLTDESRSLIPVVLESTRKYPAPDVSVIGHTDTLGDSAANERLALQRAQAVADIIRNAGLQVHDLTVVSHGEKNLLISTPDNTDEPRNRRVEVTVR